MITRTEVESGTGRVLDETDKYYLVKLFDGSELYVLKDDESVTPCLIRDFYWESWITAWFMNNIGPGTTFYDIGANTGYYSIIAANKGAKVVAFEPNIDYARMLFASSYRTYSNIDVVPVALSNYNGTALLNVPSKLHGSASLNKIDDRWLPEPVSVTVRTLDSLDMPISDSVVIKIDAEGAEEDIMEGMEKFLYGTFPTNVTIFLEYTPGSYSDMFLNNLSSTGELSVINYDGIEEYVTKEWVLSQKDWITLVVRL